MFLNFYNLLTSDTTYTQLSIWRNRYVVMYQWQYTLGILNSDSSAGYLHLMLSTTQNGMTRWLLLPRWPCCHNTNCLYAAFLYDADVYTGRSANTSLWASVTRVSTSLFSTTESNHLISVIYGNLWQHTFSSAVAMGRHFKHVHQGVDWVSCEWEGYCGEFRVSLIPCSSL